MAAIQERDGLCGVCPAGCWITATIEDGRLRAVRRHPGPLGMLCTIGAHSPAIVHDPARLKYPLRRTGPKGGHDFARASWDEAFSEIAERLRRIKAESGPEAVAIYTGRGSFELSLCDVFQPRGVAISSASSVLFPFGSPNTLGVGALCYVSFAMIAPHVTFGEYYHTTEHDIDNAELIVLWGANPATDSPPLVHEQVARAARRGAAVVCIDPRRNDTARETGAEWIPIRPGTDGALALAMIQVLIEEERFDEKFAEEWTVGFEDLRQYVQHFRPEVVEGITGVPAATIVSLARRIAAARGACPVMYTGLEYADGGVQAIRAVLILWALAGQLDVPGGLTIRMRENAFPINRSGLVANPAPKKALGRDRFPVYSAYRGESHAIALPRSVLEGEPYRIRALIVLGASLITAWPEPQLWRETLRRLDFLVTIDRHHTADSAYADLVLPAATYYEITSYMTYGPLFKIRERLIEPQGEARSDYLILTELAERLGYASVYPRTEEDLLRHVLRGSGFSLEEVRANGGEARVPVAMMEYRKWEKGRLRADGCPGFETPSGKLEIRSSILEEHGYPGLPVYTEPGEGPLADHRLARRFPLVFDSGARTFFDFRSQHHGVAGLREKAKTPLLTISVRDAATRGIRDGDQVVVETARGRAPYRALVGDDIVAGAVDAAMGGGGPLGPGEWRDCNVNELTDLQRHDPISGFPVFKALLCDVTRAGAGAAADVAPEPGGAARAERADPEPAAREVYLDHNATTSLDPEVLEAMLPYLQAEYGNASSIHRRGREAKEAIEAARRQVAESIGCTARRVVFTGGGSESDNLAIKGVAFSVRRGQVVTSRAEHPAVLRACASLEPFGFRIRRLDVAPYGRVEPAQLADAIDGDTILVSLMLANNEVGTVSAVRELSAIARARGVPFHCDAVQGLGKLPIDVEELGVDLLSISGHKVHGPKGVGALFVRKGVVLRPLVDGGGQEHGLRAGTENVAGIVGFGKACALAVRRLSAGEMERVRDLRDRLEAGLRRVLPSARRNGHPADRLPNTLNLTLPRLRGESLVLLLDRRGLRFSSGSACKSGDPAPSHVLTAMGLSDEEAHCSVRFSLGVGTTQDEIDYAVAAVAEAVAESRTSVSFVGCR